ncbi:hypothetical protein PLICRDRAFT_156689 [Plicaturopsis crispa FD-325 SS-3]|nr:hypothetical protein PLICRDRAFT_156689 [Plicaturopsis crispa FD-325 SS-3]
MTGFNALPIAETGGDGDENDRHLVGIARIRGPKWSQLPALTVGLLGVQVLWSVEMSYASPYLLELGLTKSSMAVVFLAGPLSGLIVQPLIGVLADKSTSRFGRRRPYMLGGCIVCAAAVLLLGFTREFASLFTGSGNAANDTLTVWLAIFSIYCIDFSINAVQAVDRALLVDTLPTGAQADGNAWAARMLGAGSVAGFYVGNVDLTKVFPIFGTAQLQVLSALAALVLVSTHIMTMASVSERVNVGSPNNEKGRGLGFMGEVKKIWHGAKALPRVIRQICIIQFFAWLAWFPVLFYTSVYIGELHIRASPTPPTPATEEEGTRLGAHAMLWSSIVSLAGNIALPFFVRETGAGRGHTFLSRFQVHLATMWAAGHAVFACCMAGTLFTNSVWGATILITVTGFSWAITQWIPFSLLGEAIHSEPLPGDTSSIRLADTRAPYTRVDAEEQAFLVGEDDEEVDRRPGTSSRSHSLESAEARARQNVMGNAGAQISRIDIQEPDAYLEDSESTGAGVHRDLTAQSGVILGIHNIFIVIPQFIVTGLSSIIFALFEPDKSVLHGQHPGKIDTSNTTMSVTSELMRRQEADTVPDGPNSVAIIFRQSEYSIGGVSAAIAFVLCWRLAREIRHR